MKIKKILGLVLATVTAASVMAFSGCELLNSFLGNPETPTGKNELKMEAEYIDIDDVKGAGISNNNSGLSMIYGDGTAAQKEMWSEGYYVGFMHNDGTVLTFEFNSSVATSATVTFMLGSEDVVGDITLNAENIAVLVNGEEQFVPNWLVTSSPMDAATFTACRLSSAVQLKAGKNTIEFKVLANDLGGNATRGPLMDYVTVKAADDTAELSWTPKKDNPQRRDEV